jgi:glycosyltransferase involved in cell wall biosynthesis
MNPFSPRAEAKFVVATPARSVCDDNARALDHHGLLRFLALGTRRGTAGVARERTHLNPIFGLITYGTARTLSNTRAESLRLRLHPWFDCWVKKQLCPGDHIISSYGYTNECFKWVRQNGGRTFLDGGNSHPENYWTILQEEHRRWKCPLPPIPRHHYHRAVAMMEHVDFVLSPSSFVTQSFLQRGFKPEQILKNVYPVDLSLFCPSGMPRPKDRPLTIINTGSLSLRKGTPYLLEAFRKIHQQHPSARFLLTEVVEKSVRPVLAKYNDLPIDWSPGLPHHALAERLRQADIFVLPSLEDGFARTVTEALACGLPVVLTPNTGACDIIQPGVNGEIVPIRDAQAISHAVLKWADKVMMATEPPRSLFNTETVLFSYFERNFISQLAALGLAPRHETPALLT